MGFSTFFLIAEMTSIQELLSDPKNNNKDFDDILKDFKAHGGEVLGTGAFATALWHPSWKYVLKIFHGDISYLKFARFVMKNPRPSFPKFLDKPRKIIPNFKRSYTRQDLYFIKMEKLNPITEKEFDKMKDIIDGDQKFKSLSYSIDKTQKQLRRYEEKLREYAERSKQHENKLRSWSANPEEAIKKHRDAWSNDATYNDILRDMKSIQTDLKELWDRYNNWNKNIQDMKNAYPELAQFFEDCQFLKKGLSNIPDIGGFDLHSGNIMKRDNGQFVITDPVAFGGNEKISTLRNKKMNDYDMSIRQKRTPRKDYLKGGERFRFTPPAPPKGPSDDKGSSDDEL